MKFEQEEDVDAFFDDVLSRAIIKIREAQLPLFTFAFYHDHESSAVSVCADTVESSAKTVIEINGFNRRHFSEALANGDLKGLSLWTANPGRSLSLGDFAMVNVARRDFDTGTKTGKDFYLSMVRAVVAKESEIVALAKHPEQLLFCCSGAQAEVAFIWAATQTAQ